MNARHPQSSLLRSTMSSLSVEIVSTVRSNLIQKYFLVAAFSLLLYEQVLASGSEVKFIWHAGKPGALYLLNRFNTMMLCAWLMLGLWSSKSTSSCTAFSILSDVTTIASLLLWTTLSALRVFAVSGRNRVLTVATIALALVPVATNLYAITQSSIQFVPVGDFQFCAIVNGISATGWTRLTILTKSCAIASDALVVLVIWYFIPQAGNLKHNLGTSSRPSLSLLLWQNGIIYFITLAIVNCAQIALYVTSTLFNLSADTQTYNPIPVLLYPITSIIITRFTLDLRRLAVAAHNASHSERITLPPTEVSSGLPTSPHASIIRWTTECLAADRDAPTDLGSILEPPDDVEDAERGDVQVERHASLGA